MNQPSTESCRVQLNCQSSVSSQNTLHEQNETSKEIETDVENDLMSLQKFIQSTIVWCKTPTTRAHPRLSSVSLEDIQNNLKL